MNTRLSMRWRLLTLLLCCYFLGQYHQAQAQGAAGALRFNGSGHVNLGDSLSHSLAQSDFTIEMWIKINSNSSDPVFIGNKNWASGSNTGLAWCRYASNTIRFNFRAAGRTRKDYNMSLDYSRWNHIAITVQRNGNITGYVNGVQNGTPVSIAADSGYSIDAGLPFRLGADGNATYLINADMDEVRIWNTVRTAAEIRSGMCQTIPGSASGLLAYYRMDEPSGTSILNHASISTGVYTGDFVNTPLRISSPAAIGDEAVSLYASSYAGQSLQLSSPANGTVTVANIGDAMTGLHLYKINVVPVSTNGISNPGTNAVYYGVFTVSDTTDYSVQYNYTNFPDANTYEGGIDLFHRAGAEEPWALWAAAKNVTTNVLTKAAVSGRQELIVGSFVSSITCDTPSALLAQNITTATAELSWTTGGSNAWNLSYGQGNFTPGGAGATTLTNLSASSYMLNNLQQNTTYAFYVQDTCLSINGASAWSGPYTFTTAINYANYGSGYALDFPGTAAHANLGDSLSGAIATTNFTIETWIKFNNPSSDPSFIGNKNWNSGQNTGIIWCWNGNNTLRFNFKPAGGSRKDYDITVPDPAAWNHIAMVVDRNGSLTAYLNGVPAGTPINIAADSGLSLDGTLPMRIAQDGTGTYGPKFKGAMDELRIWKKALTMAEIREHMCRKLDGTDTSLLAYYRMDEASGTNLSNLSASGAIFDGILVNNPQRIISGAAIGDTSVQLYPASWTGTSLSLGTPAYGQLTIDSVAANTLGVQLYRLNQVPNSINGIAQPGGTQAYFGVFTPGNKMATYRMVYDYSNYPDAVTNNAQLHLYSRLANDVMQWVQTPATNIPAQNQLRLTAPSGVQQVILADFSAVPCTTPQNVMAGNIDTGSATISWTSAAAGHTIEYGVAGFTQGNGTLVSGTGTNLLLTNLSASSLYQYYIKDSCSPAASSVWAGPFYFTTLNPCPQPVNIHADSITAASMVVKWEDNGVVTQDYIVSWGMQGFGNPAFGIQTNVTDKRYELTAATPNTTYDFYIRTNCNASVSNSGWTGPYAFTTLSCDPAQDVQVGSTTATGAAVSWTSTADHWMLSLGQPGFDPQNGTLAGPVATPQYTFSGLNANTAYEFYIQDSCALGLNPWQGPYTFTTAQPNSIQEQEQAGFKLYPNPASTQLIISRDNGEPATLVLYNQIGVKVGVYAIKGTEALVNLEALPNGIYWITIRQEQGSGTRRLLIQH